MSQPRRGLGRGLDALLGEAPRVATVPPTGAPLSIALDAIRPNPRQPRERFDPAALVELERSIRELGVLVPILVRARAGGMYELIAGERRWRAAAAAGLREIPAIVRETDDRGSLEIAIIENLQREDLDPLEEAMGFANLLDEHGFTQDRLAERLGKSRPAIANALRLLALSDAIKADVRAGRLSAGHARALLALPQERRDAAAKRAVAEGLSVRALEALASAEPGARKRSAPPAPARDPNLADVEARLRYRFGAAVRVEARAGGGRIEIRAASPADLTRIVDLLLDET